MLTRHYDPIFSFFLILAFAGAVAAALSWMTYVGFVLGAITVLAAAVVAGANADFE